MTRGRGIKRSWGDRGGMSSKREGGYQQLLNTSQEDISEPSTPTFQQVGSNHRIVSSREGSFQQIVHTSQDANAQQTTVPENVGGQQETPTSLDVGRQTPFSQNVGAQQETPAQDVSPEQTVASFGSSNPHVTQDTLGGIKSLKVNGDTFCPYEAVRDVVLAFKKSFSGPWHCWSKVPEHVKDKWFNDFEKNYTFLGEDKVLIRKTFNRVGSERLSDSLEKAKKAFSRTKKIPKWIAQVHWGCLMQYWNSEDFKKISAINSKNRMSFNNGEGPSLHTGGSVAFAEYRRRHKELTGEDFRSDELFLKTHKIKNKKNWICGKLERIWNTFTNTIKEKVGETSTLRNEEGLEVDDGDMERNTTTNGEEEGGENSEDNDVTLLKTIPEEQLLNTWIQTVGGTKKGKIYGLGPRNCLLADSSNTDCASFSAPTPSNVPTQQMFETPEFQQLLDRVLEQRMANMQEHMEVGIRENMEAEVNITVRVAVARILGFTPQPPTNGSGSPPNIS